MSREEKKQVVRKFADKVREFAVTGDVPPQAIFHVIFAGWREMRPDSGLLFKDVAEACGLDEEQFDPTMEEFYHILNGK